MTMLRQCFPVCLAMALSAATMSFVVLQNFREEGTIKNDKERFFSSPRNLELALLVFACTFVAQSKALIWHYLEMFLRTRFSCGPIATGLVHVSLCMVCVSLFDFRIIHVSGSSRMLRTSILFADLTSLFLAESLITYDKQTCRSGGACCCAVKNTAKPL